MFDETSHGSQAGGYHDDDHVAIRHVGTHMSVSSEPESGERRNISVLYHGNTL